MAMDRQFSSGPRRNLDRPRYIDHSYLRRWKHPLRRALWADVWRWPRNDAFGPCPTGGRAVRDDALAQWRLAWPAVASCVAAGAPESGAQCPVDVTLDGRRQGALFRPGAAI